MCVCVWRSKAAIGVAINVLSLSLSSFSHHVPESILCTMSSWVKGSVMYVVVTPLQDSVVVLLAVHLM